MALKLPLALPWAVTAGLSAQQPVVPVPQDEMDAYFSMQGMQAQNYHVFTPAEGKRWAMAWGCQAWVKELPYANRAQVYHFRPGEGGL